MRAVLLALALTLTLTLSLTACGKRGAPQAPGPAADVTWPKRYPAN